MGNEWHWQGASGAWYTHLIWAFPSSLAAIPANYIAVRRAPDGTRRAIFIGETDDLNRCWRDHATTGLLAQALGLGANELHLNGSGRDNTERDTIETDLRRGQDAPLNRRPAPDRHAAASSFSNLGLPSFAHAHAFAGADPIVELANALNALSASTGKQTPLWVER